MLITVYIVNYNYSSFIATAIESVLSQSYLDFELLIIDDGSTDESKAVIERFHDPRIKVFYRSNHGLIANCNFALSLAKGQYILRLDADDFLAASALLEMSNIVQCNININLVYSNYYVVNRFDEILGHRERIPFEENKILDSPAHGACCLIRVNTLLEIGGYQLKYKKQDGYYLWFKFLDFGGIESIRKPLFYYRRHDTNMTNNYDEIIAARNKIILNESKCNLHGVIVLPVKAPVDITSSINFIQRLSKEYVQWRSLIRELIVITSDIRFLAQIEESIPSNLVRVVSRTTEEESSMGLIKMLKDTPDLRLSPHDFVVTLDAHYNKVDIDIIRTAVYTLHKFGADRVVSVVPESGMLFRRTDKGLSFFYSGSSYHKPEREDLYRFSAGINVFNINAIEAFDSYDDFKTAHVLVESRFL